MITMKPANPAAPPEKLISSATLSEAAGVAVNAIKSFFGSTSECAPWAHCCNIC